MTRSIESMEDAVGETMGDTIFDCMVDCVTDSGKMALKIYRVSYFSLFISI